MTNTDTTSRKPRTGPGLAAEPSAFVLVFRADGLSVHGSDGDAFVALVAVRPRGTHTALVRAHLGAHDPEDGHGSRAGRRTRNTSTRRRPLFMRPIICRRWIFPCFTPGSPVQFRIMAKKELFRYPFLGWHLKRSGQIPIDSGDARASLRSLTHASESLRHGTPLVVFPEGGRSATGHLQEFMGGASYVAIRAQAPIVPIAIVGTDGAAAHEQLPSVCREWWR